MSYSDIHPDRYTMCWEEYRLALMLVEEIPEEARATHHTIDERTGFEIIWASYGQLENFEEYSSIMEEIAKKTDSPFPKGANAPNSPQRRLHKQLFG